MPYVVPAKQFKIYDDLRSQGFNRKQAAERAGISYQTAWRRDGGVGRAETINGHLRVIPPGSGGKIKAYKDLSAPAKRAWDDFSYFQRRYLGRIATPWQKEAAELVVAWLDNPGKDYVVVNAPPGCGKSTTFTHDIPLWVTVRNRAIRGQIGSKVQSSAERYVTRIKNDLIRTVPYQPEAEDIAKGLAIPAEATIPGDFGVFRPEKKEDLWSAQGFVVAQHGGVLTAEKEPTWSAFGMDSGFLGMRYDLIIWDDLVDKKTLRTAEAKETIREWWDDVAEKRLEPNGVLILQGQRMGADDLYRYALDKRVLPDEESEEDENDDAPDRPAKYQHIVFKAHYEDRCEGEHRLDSPYYPDGCLLDPRRLTWRELRSEMANKRNNFAVIYQQEDIDPENVLVDPMWIKGGTDPKTGEVFPGCLDKDRGLCEIPHGLYGHLLSVATADPSPTKNWAIEWWVVRVVDGKPQERYLMDLIRQRMDAPSFLDWHNATQTFTGIMQDWQDRSVELHLPITTWIVEKNGAQNFMLQYEHVRRWLSEWRVRLIPHNTHTNKSDEQFGVQTLGPLYKYGMVRLPYRSTHGSGSAFSSTQKLIEELTKWPEGATDDTVMANWFLEWNLPRLVPPAKPLPRQPRPSWMKSASSWSWGNREARI